jgi:membrane protease YdiL (CAAX protease family)
MAPRFRGSFTTQDWKMNEMAVESKAFPKKDAAIPLGLRVSNPRASTGLRRVFVWTGIAVVFLLLEFALWAPTTALRNRWAAITAFAILVFVLIDGAAGRTSLKHLGLRWPNIADASVVFGIGVATAVFLLLFVDWLGGEIPANPTWFPNLQSTWSYVLWSTVQEFILLSFFFNRFEELLGSSAAVWMASALFAAVHLPSPVLTVATLIGSLFFCEMFRRFRSIYPVALVHAMLGLTVALVVPDSLLHHMRVGIGYLRY